MVAFRLPPFAALALGAALALTGAGAPLPTHAHTLLQPEGGTVAGELGRPLGGAQAALGTGAEAMFVNPAGLVEPGRFLVTAGVRALTFREVEAGSTTTRSVRSGPAYAAMTRPFGRTPRGPRFAWGLSFHWPTEQSGALRLRLLRPGTTADLPAAVRTSPAAGNFPPELTVREQSSGDGTLSVAAPALGFAVAAAEWVRFGAALRFERVSLTQRSRVERFFAGTSADGATTLDAHALGDLELTAESTRLVYVLGLQMDLGPSVTVGAVMRLPSDTLSGKGNIRLLRQDGYTLSGSTSSADSGLARFQADDLDFRLDTPRALRLGVALRSDWVLLELDMERVATLGPYTVLPALQAGPPSTRPDRLEALRGGSEGATRWALGVAMGWRARTAWLLGLQVEPATVKADDPLFRRVDRYTLSGGMYRVAGRLSGTLGAFYRFADAPALRFADPTLAEDTTAAVALREVGLQMAGSMTF